MVLCRELLVASVANASGADYASLLDGFLESGEIDEGNQQADRPLQISLTRSQSFVAQSEEKINIKCGW